MKRWITVMAIGLMAITQIGSSFSQEIPGADSASYSAWQSVPATLGTTKLVSPSIATQDPLKMA
jgi:hypothetical protein